MIGRKQRSTQAQWLQAWAAIGRGEHDSAPMRARFMEAVSHVLDLSRRARVGFGWSGGKDSLALELVCREAGVGACVFGMTDLEYPAFLRWVTDHMPPELDVIRLPLGLPWLARNPEMLFPRTAAAASRWFRLVQQEAQARFFRGHGLDVLLLGRRRADGNVLGASGAAPTATRRGIRVWCPLADWPHEDVLALLHARRVALPPTYGWPRGYQVGTGPWPARQWTQSVRHGWEEVWTIDPDVVRGAAPWLPSARNFLEAKEAAWCHRRQPETRLMRAEDWADQQRRLFARGGRSGA